MFEAISGLKTFFRGKKRFESRYLKQYLEVKWSKFSGFSKAQKSPVVRARRLPELHFRRVEWTARTRSGPRPSPWATATCSAPGGTPAPSAELEHTGRASDRINCISSHQNSVKILPEFRQIGENSSSSIRNSQQFR